MAVNGDDEFVRSNIQDVLDSVAKQQSLPACQPDQQQDGVASSGLQEQQAGPSCSSCGMLDVRTLQVQHSSEATIRLLKARMKSLEEQLGMAMQLNQEKDAEILELQKQVKANSQKEAASNKGQKALEAQVERHRRAAEAAREALAAKEQQLKELSKDATQADKTRHLAEQECRTRDVRLQRALEEVERYKQLLQDVKVQGQEVKDVARSEHVKALSEVKRLERQKGELVGVLRKQAKLIDVLRRQRAHLEAARLLAFTEEDFMRTLDTGA